MKPLHGRNSSILPVQTTLIVGQAGSGARGDGPEKRTKPMMMAKDGMKAAITCFMPYLDSVITHLKIIDHHIIMTIMTTRGINSSMWYKVQ